LTTYNWPVVSVGDVTEADEDRADTLFHALADRTRRDIMRRVLTGEHSVSALAANYDMSFAAPVRCYGFEDMWVCNVELETRGVFKLSLSQPDIHSCSRHAARPANPRPAGWKDLSARRHADRRLR
jgi:DNA-binding transcriptional ArsR family regulator